MVLERINPTEFEARAFITGHALAGIPGVRY